MFWQTIDMAQCVGLGSIWISFPYLPVPCTSVTYNENYNISNLIHMLFRNTVSWLFNHSNNKLGKRYWHIKVLDLIADLLKCTVLNCLQFVHLIKDIWQMHVRIYCLLKDWLFFSSPRYMYWYVSKCGLTNIATVCKRTTIMKPKVWVNNFSSTVSSISAILYNFFWNIWPT